MALQLSEDRISFTARRNEIIEGLHSLPGLIKQVLNADQSLQQLATGVLASSRSLLLMGRGYQCVTNLIILTQCESLTLVSNRHATCLEGALKIKEISYMHSEGKTTILIFFK